MLNKISKAPSTPKTKNHTLYQFLMILAILIIELSTDLHLPNLPEMTRHFQVNQPVVSLTISAYLLGLSFLGMFFGPLSDAIGRRPVFLLSLGFFAFSSVLSLVASDIYMLIGCRFAQGLAAGAIFVVNNAIIRDIFSERVCARIFSSISMIVAISPAAAPLLGAHMASLYSWYHNFVMIALASLLVLFTHFIFLPESLNVDQRQIFSARNLLQTYKTLLCRKKVMGFALISGLMCGAIWSWITVAPFYFIETLSFAPQEYACFSLATPGAYILGAIYNQFFVEKKGLKSLLVQGLFITIFGTIILNLAVYLYPDNLLFLLVGLLFFGFGLAPVFSNSATLCVSVEPHFRGGASAILTLCETSCAALFAYIATYTNNGTLGPSMMIVGFTVAFSTLIFFLLLRFYPAYLEDLSSGLSK